MDESFESWEETVREIADEFEIPQTTAAAWNRHIGDLEDIKTKLLSHASDEYINLIQKRERLLQERSDREGQWTDPLYDWIHESIDTTSLGRDSKHDDEYRRKREQVRYEMRRYDSVWIRKTQKIRQVENRLVEIYRDYLNECEFSLTKKKDKIIELKTRFPYLRANNHLTARAADSSISYAKKFKHIPGEGVASRRVKGKLRKKVLERDNQCCVSCGSAVDLVVHHIVPRNDGGENVIENLATLCKECHYYAHGGGKPAGNNRYTTADWDDVEYSDQATFWEKWINTDFDERMVRSSARLNNE